MSTLHTINKSPFRQTALESCLRLITEGDVILLIEDGVYAALDNTDLSPRLEQALIRTPIYALQADLLARGIEDTSLIAGIKQVDYAGFVNLSISQQKVLAW